MAVILAVTGRICLFVAVHAAFDLKALALIHWHLESTVADLVFTERDIVQPDGDVLPASRRTRRGPLR
jgi:hypothetical protein